jgi:hypothetical protein
MKGEKERDSIPPISIAYPVENYICTLMIWWNWNILEPTQIQSG